MTELHCCIALRLFVACTKKSYKYRPSFTFFLLLLFHTIMKLTTLAFVFTFDQLGSAQVDGANTNPKQVEALLSIPCDFHGSTCFNQGRKGPDCLKCK